MYQVRHVPFSQLPLEISLQASSFIRIVWGGDEKGEDRFWQISGSDGVLEHFYIAERGVLISYAEVSRRTISHLGQSYDVRGVGGVFTYPAFRNEGCGTQLVAAFSDSIRSSGADIGLLFTGLGHHPFYRRNGWITVNREGVYYGDPAQPEFSDSHLMILPVSEKGMAHRDDFERDALYVGKSTW